MAARKKTTKKSAPKKTNKPAAKAKPKKVLAKAKPKKAVAKAKPKKVVAKAKPKKAVAKAKPKKAVAKAKPKKKAASRRDATGHLNRQYAADLRKKSRESHEDLGADRAFLRKSRSDDLAEELGEEAVQAMTSGDANERILTDLEVEEERGGPFVRTTGRQEYAGGTDRSNPRSATREPFPKT